MKRIWATLLTDVRLQLRNGFYFAAAFVAVSVIGLLSWLDQETLRRFLPVLLASNLLIGTLYFNAAIVLLDKGDGVLESLAVTPLPAHEYLLARVLSLALLSFLEAGAVVLFTVGVPAAPLPLFAGLLLLAAFLSLLGFVIVIRYDSINEFLLPSILLVSPLFLPVLGYFAIWNTPLFLLHPLQPFLDLFAGGFSPASPLRLAYGLAGGLFWCAIAFWWAVRAFQGFVVRGAGERP